MLQYCSTPRTAFENNEALQKELENKAAKISDTCGRHVILTVPEFDWDDRVGILSASDVGIDTAIKDGFNVAPLEFLAAHMEDEQGVVIVSDFAGRSRALMGSRRINPWSIDSISTGP